MLSEKWKDAFGWRGGKSSEVLLTTLDESTYREGSLTSDSFHFYDTDTRPQVYLTNHWDFARPRKPP